MHLSVIICTHNPREDYLRRTLEALEKQTLPKDQWELLLIDNASVEPLAGKWDLSWHPGARHIREDELGLTPARLRGIRESEGELLVFVDDDNLLEHDYLAIATTLMTERPWLGAIGGSIRGEFEVPPSEEVRCMLPGLALVEVNSQAWARCGGSEARGFAPCGAGMVVRQCVAEHYFRKLAGDPLRRGFDRKGSSLASGGDTDMALCACELGLAVGRFPQLRMTHLIPPGRLEKSYLLRLAEDLAFSDAVLQYLWDRRLPRVERNEKCRSERIYAAYVEFRRRLKGGKVTFETEVAKAQERGRTRALDVVISLEHPAFGSELNGF